MLKSLRMHLTLLCTCITSLILLIVCLMSLQISEAQLSSRNQLAFENQLQTIAYQLQSQQTIKSSWLAKLETDYNAIISIQDNGAPFLFKGAWLPDTPRDTLIHNAHVLGKTKYNFDITLHPTSSLSPPKAFFQMQGEHDEYYRVGLITLPAARGFHSVTLLQDMTEERLSIWHTRILFFTISLIGLTLLGIFSYWFAGRAILPIETNKRKQTDFIAAASHELKSPLAVIKNNNAIIQDGTPDIISFTTQIEKECNRMARLVDDLLLLTTADANTWSIKKEPVDIDTLLIELLDNYLSLAHQKNLTLNLSLPDHVLAPLPCDKERILQVLCILIDNALCYVPPNGHITLILTTASHHLTLKVVDDGPGIPAEHHAHIFDRFYRVDASRKDKNHYGLGLSIATEMIKLHQGTLTLEDTPDGGCTFVIRLPYKSL
ncbi:MAG: sensor histidine kinase [Cellulosilyticaceae bacterium]